MLLLLLLVVLAGIAAKQREGRSASCGASSVTVGSISE